MDMTGTPTPPKLGKDKADMVDKESVMGQFVASVVNQAVSRSLPKLLQGALDHPSSAFPYLPGH